MFVYLIKYEDANLYKIGISKNPKNRLKQLQTSNPQNLLLLEQFKTNYGFKLERYVQLNLKNNNIKLEWFESDSDFKEEFIEACKRGEKIFDTLKNNTYMNDYI